MSVQDGSRGTANGASRRTTRKASRRPLTTRDIATIAVLASLGGVMSAYIGYLGVALNKLIGTPFGAGQFLAGLHVFWMMLAIVLTNRVGVGTATGALKGMVELLAGSSKGVLVLLLSITAGLIIDAVWAAASRREPWPHPATSSSSSCSPPPSEGSCGCSPCCWLSPSHPASSSPVSWWSTSRGPWHMRAYLSRRQGSPGVQQEEHRDPHGNGPPGGDGQPGRGGRHWEWS